MAIQMRRGVYADFDPSKLVAGEIAVVQSGDGNNPDSGGRSVYVCFNSGVVKRFATYDDVVSNVNAATEEIQNQFAERIENDIETVETHIAEVSGAIEECREITEEAKKLVLDDIGVKTVTFSPTSTAMTSGSTLSELISSLAFLDSFTTDEWNYIKGGA